MAIEKTQNTAELQNEYEQMMNEAFKMFPNLRSDLQAISEATTDIDSYRQYLEILNQAPAVITTNYVG